MTQHPLLGGLSDTGMLKVLNHSEQRRTIHVIANLLTLMDRAGHSAVDLYNFQTVLFRASYRAQRAAADISRALKRLAGGKTPDWQGQHDTDMLNYLQPLWTPSCPVDSRNPADWELEAVAAARIVHQLRDVGDGLAWRVHHYDRGLITALSDHPAVGPIVPKDGLDAEIGRIAHIFRETGHFTLMHDLTTVLRHHDLTEVHANGYRELQEVKKNTSSNRARSDAAKQRREAEAALKAAAGDAPLTSTAHITRSTVQLRTHIRDLSGVLTVAQRDGHVVTRIGDRIVAALHWPTITASGMDVHMLWDRHQIRIAEARQRWMPTANSPLHNKMTFADRDERNAFLAPFSIFPLPAAQRAALICDLVLVETFMDVQALAAGFANNGTPARILLNRTSQPGDDILDVVAGSRKMTLHAAALPQLLHEMVHTGCFAKAFTADGTSQASSGKYVIVFSNERAAWR